MHLNSTLEFHNKPDGIPSNLYNMKKKLISQGLKCAYLELEGVNYNAVHYRQNRNRYQKMIEAVLPLSNSGKILDIGAGFCYLTKFFKFQGYEVYAIADLPHAF